MQRSQAGFGRRFTPFGEGVPRNNPFSSLEIGAVKLALTHDE
jgi:hypothetical protein